VDIISELAATAQYLSLAVGLVVDPTAGEGERWVATIGLDCSGAGPTPGAALDAAALDLWRDDIERMRGTVSMIGLPA